jgi:hypothetical protein
MEISAAVANGRDAMDGLWSVEKPAPVLYLDGEMHWADIKERGRMLKLGEVKILSKTVLEYHDAVNMNLAEEKIRSQLKRKILEQGIKLVVIDNIFSLVLGLETNQDKDWSPINQWLLSLRSNGVSVILIHHTGKGGDQLGTSSRVFNLNFYLLLKPEASEDESVAFQIKVAKQRKRGIEIAGKRFHCIDGEWTVTELSSRELAENKRQEIATLLVQGAKQKEVAEQLEMSEARVSQIKRELIKEGMLEQEDKKINYTDEGKSWAEVIPPDESI